MNGFKKTLAAMAATFALVAAPAMAAETIVLGLMPTGTAKWELTAMQNLGIDKKHDLTVEVRETADAKAGQIALQAGEVDIILSDFYFVSTQRAGGNDVTIIPHSLAVGGLVVDPAAGIKTIADLKGKTLGVSGSPIDKSYVVLQAYYKKQTGGDLANDATVRFGAPPLINEIIGNGEAQAALNLWNWNARALAAGKTELISVGAMMSDLGVTVQPPLLGWAFLESNAAKKPAAFKAFFDASFETKQALLTDDAVWEGLKEVMNVADNPALFDIYKAEYRKGIVKAYDASIQKAASDAYALFAQYGGKEVVGDATELAPGTFWQGYVQ